MSHKSSDSWFMVAPDRTDQLSSQTSSIRQQLYWLFTIMVSPFTFGCQQVAVRA
jgi:hypothetical protein